MDFDASRNEPLPASKSSTDIASLVVEDIHRRAQVGEQKYGERLRPFNGRSALVDAYQEALDLCMYLRQLIEENRSSKRNVRMFDAMLRADLKKKECSVCGVEGDPERVNFFDCPICNYTFCEKCWQNHHH